MADVLFSQLLTHPVNVSSFSSSSGVTFHILFCFVLFFIFFVVIVLSFFCHEEIATLYSKLLMLPSSRRVWMYNLEGKCISIQEFMSCLS